MIVARLKVYDACALAEWANPITAGMVGAEVQIEYAGPEWDGLTKTVVFSGAVVKDVITNDTVIRIPAECLAVPNALLKVGVYGISADGAVAIPTLWAPIGRVLRGTDPSGDEETNPTLPVWTEMLLASQRAEEIANGVRADAEAGRFNGAPGQHGYTPVKGVDYFTQGEVAEIEAGAAKKLEPELSKVKDDIAAEAKRAKDAEDNRIKKFYTGNLGAVSVADSDDGAVRNLVIGGKCEQVATTGAQLLDIPGNMVDYERQGVKWTINPDGSITVKGATEENYSVITKYYLSLPIGKYTLSMMQSSEVRTIITLKRDQVEWIIVRGQTSQTFTVDGTESLIEFYLQVNPYTTVDSTVYPMLNAGDTAIPWEPYTGGAPSPSPDYPQEIKSVDNCAMIVSNADGTETQTAAIPFTMRGIGDARDELYVYADGTGKLVQRLIELKLNLNKVSYLENTIRCVQSVPQNISRGPKTKGFCNKIHKVRYSTEDTPHFYIDNGFVNAFLPKDTEDLTDFVFVLALIDPIETTLTAEQVKALFDLRSYYGGTNISFDTENGVEPTVNFDYACAMDAFVEYIKAAQGDDRKFIYDMGERLTQAEVTALEASIDTQIMEAMMEV